MRCYFHLIGPDDSIPDDIGIEASSHEVAEAEALQAIQELRNESSDKDWQGWQLEVTDASQCVLLIISLDPGKQSPRMWRPCRASRGRGSLMHGVLLVLGCEVDWQIFAPMPS